MIFLDTCVWFELLGVRTPVKPHEIQQATAASELLGRILKNKENIITCKEQLIELVSAIEKVTMKTYPSTFFSFAFIIRALISSGSVNCFADTFLDRNFKRG